RNCLRLHTCSDQAHRDNEDQRCQLHGMAPSWLNPCSLRCHGSAPWQGNLGYLIWLAHTREKSTKCPAVSSRGPAAWAIRAASLLVDDDLDVTCIAIAVVEGQHCNTLLGF